MKFSLVLCTYMRPESICRCLDSIVKQSKIPDEVLIIDGSLNECSGQAISKKNYQLPIRYFYVDPEHRGLTRQRNFGVSMVSEDIDVVVFMDDDVVVSENYFTEIEKTYLENENTIGVGGITTNEIKWKKVEPNEPEELGYFTYDGWKRREDIRYRLRKLLGLVSSQPPGQSSGSGQDRPIGALPPSGKIYKVDNLIGLNMSYKKSVFKDISFSTFFEGYGLYEDKDFSLQASKFGNIFINTKANVEHHHDPLGRPNYIKYGKMVVWNGWRVWRVATPNPSFKNKFIWWTTTIFLTYIRFGNFVVGPERKTAIEDFIGRNISIISLIFTKPDMSDV